MIGAGESSAGRGMQVEYKAPDQVGAVIASLGRTEDIRFSPGNRRLAIAAFTRGRVAVMDVAISTAGNAVEVALSNAIEITAPCFRYPHGLDFIDDSTLVVANRMGDLAVIELPDTAAGCVDLAPAQVLAAGNGSLLRAPGSVALMRHGPAAPELLVCNNAGHCVTRHRLDRATHVVGHGEVLLRRWLDLPDGIAASDDRRWIAVSNHNTHNVLLYENAPSLGEDSKPDGVLRGACFPHGLRFSADARHLLVADAGAPFVHVYASADGCWRGTRSPARSLRVMDDALFRRGRQNPQEGGPKGLDLDRGMSVLAITSEHQPLAFFDLSALLADMAPPLPPLDVEYEIGILQHAAHLRQLAAKAEARAAKAEKRLRRRKAKGLRAAVRRIAAALRGT